MRNKNINEKQLFTLMQDVHIFTCTRSGSRDLYFCVTLDSIVLYVLIQECFYEDVAIASLVYYYIIETKTAN